jgi:spore coat polysaccharide biosynthesis predicted glycosyltransferase SpsG
MRFLLSLEASHQRGMGHLFRGLRLAQGLRRSGADVHVAINDDAVSRCILDAAGLRHDVVSLDVDGWEAPLLAQHRPDWWIDDRLDTPRAHALRVRGGGARLATFDDHGEGAALAEHDFLALDPAPAVTAPNGHYGPAFIVLAPEVAALRDGPRRFTPPLELLVTLGGSDTHGVTPRVVAALGDGLGAERVEVVVGPGFRHADEIEQASASWRVRVRSGVPSLAEAIAAASLVVCGGGVTCYEAAALGVPAVIVANEPHELPVARWLEDRRFATSVGLHTEPFEPRLTEAVGALLRAPGELARRGAIGRELVDCRGLERVLSLLGVGNG